VAKTEFAPVGLFAMATLPAYCSVSSNPRISRVRGSIDEISPCSYSVCAPPPARLAREIMPSVNRACPPRPNFA